MSVPVIVLISVFSSLLFLFLVYLFLIRTKSRKDEMEKYKSLYYAHRGLHGETREENSLSAFRAAVEAGYGIELDVRLSKDGVLVVFHDDTLDRVTGISGRVDEKTAEELSKIRLGKTTDTIPTFSEVLSLVDGRVPLLVEIKEDAGKYGVTESCVEMLRSYKGDFIIESFNPLALARVKKLMPEALRGVLSESFLKEKQYRTPTHFLLSALALNFLCRPDFIAFNHKHCKNPALRLSRRLFGVPTLAWTVRSEKEHNEALKNGFDGVIFENYIPRG